MELINIGFYITQSNPLYVLKFLHKAILNQLIHEYSMDSARTEEVRVERKEMRWEGKERIEPCLLPAGRRGVATAWRWAATAGRGGECR
jgi:hypothetical protein